MPILNSYVELQKFFHSLDFYMEKKKIGPLTITARASIGCILVSGSLEKLIKFSTNRYFIDAIKISEVPIVDHLTLNSVNEELTLAFNIAHDASFQNDQDILQQLTQKIYDRLSSGNQSNKIEKLVWTTEFKNSFEENGYVVIPNFFDSEVADNCRDELYHLASREVEKDTAFLYGYGNTGQRVYNLIEKTSMFDSLLSDKRIAYILNDLFRRDTLHPLYTMASWHANFLKPGAAAQILHSDLALPNPLPEWTARININFILEDYILENGATQCVPGSHKIRRTPTNLDAEQNENKMVSLIAEKGSIVIWTGHLWHRSGENKSDKTRVAALACYAASYLLEIALEENHPLIISRKRKTELSSELQQLFALNHGIK